MTDLITTFLKMDEIEVIKIMADKSRPAAERKIAQCVSSFIEVSGYAASHERQAEKRIADINAWNEGKPLFTPRTRETDFSVSRPDITRLLQDAVEYRTAAAEWMAYAQQVAANPSIVA
jgi:hypothetical protein